MSLDENKKTKDNIIERRLYEGGIMKTIVTISRQYGSGGRFIGKLLADELGIPFYDKEIIAQASENSGFAQEFIKNNEQKMRGISSFAFTPSVFGANMVSNFENIESRIYSSEADAIEKFAKQGACVIVGRCADYVLKEKYKCLDVFIHADMKDRIDRVINIYRRTDDAKKAERLIKENDRMRARHYRYYTDAEWGESDNYHITLNSTAIGVENCARILKEAYLRFDEE